MNHRFTAMTFNLRVAVEVDGKRMLLDLTSGSSDTGRLNRKDIGTEGWIVSADVQGWIEIFGGKEE